MWNSPSHRRGRRANESEIWTCHSLPLSPLPLPPTSLTWFNIIRYHASSVLFINFILYHEHYNVRGKKNYFVILLLLYSRPPAPTLQKKIGRTGGDCEPASFRLWSCYPKHYRNKLCYKYSSVRFGQSALSRFVASTSVWWYAYAWLFVVIIYCGHISYGCFVYGLPTLIIPTLRISNNKLHFL